MDVVLNNLLSTQCWIFLDDLIVFSHIAEEHAQRLKEVLRRFDETNLQLHPEKCVISQPEMHHLSYVWSEKDVAASLTK
jgi:hypothetical protein